MIARKDHVECWCPGGAQTGIHLLPNDKDEIAAHLKYLVVTFAAAAANSLASETKSSLT